MSADDLAGQFPYGFVTRMLRVIGFEQFETNRVVTCRNVMEANCNSIYARCLVLAKCSSDRPQRFRLLELCVYDGVGLRIYTVHIKA